MRWVEKLQEFEHKIQYRAGNKNANADALSRIDDNSVIRLIFEEEFREGDKDMTIKERNKKERNFKQQKKFCANIIKKWEQNSEDLVFTIKDKKLKKVLPRWKVPEEELEVREEQRKDNFLGQFYSYLSDENFNFPRNQKMVQKIKNEIDKFEMVENALYKIISNHKDKSKKVLRLAIPTVMKRQVMYSHHNAISAEHLGVFKTYNRIAERYWWKGMYQDVKNWVICCKECQHRKKSPDLSLGMPMSTTSERPFHTIGADIFGPLPKSERGNKYVLVVIDHFTKWVEAFAIPNQEAETIGDIFVNEIISRHRVPERILTDRGKNFIGKVISWIEHRLDIKQMKTSSLHSQTNALTERFNKTMAEMLTMFVNTNQKDWNVYLPGVLFAYRTVRHSTTEFSPFFLLYRREVREPTQLVELDKVNQERYQVEDYAEMLVQNLQKAMDQVRNSEEIKRTKRNANLAKSRKDHPFKLNDLVMLHTKPYQKGRTVKLSATWHGPYRITEFKTLVTVILGHPGKKKRKQQPVHVNRLKFFIQEENEDLAAILEEDETVKGEDRAIWEVQEITGVKKLKSETKYRVRWKGFPDSESTWEPVEELTGVRQVVVKFHKKNNL